VIYALLDQNGVCTQHIVWDGVTEWQPPEGYTAVPDPDRTYVVQMDEPAQSEADPLADLTFEQKQALINLLQSNS